MRKTTSGAVRALVLACGVATGGCGGGGNGDGGSSDTPPLCPYISVTLDPVADAGPGTCIYQLEPPPDIAQLMYPELHETGAGGSTVVVPQDGTHLSGWDFTDSSKTAIEIYGSVCAAVQSGSATLQVTYFCNLI
jgi:hypothetical protein